MIWKADDRNSVAMMPATIRSGHPVAVPQTPNAASITATLPIASLREHSQTDRTLASPSLYRTSSATLARLAASAMTPTTPLICASGTAT